jgi:hypothetical protein
MRNLPALLLLTFIILGWHAVALSTTARPGLAADATHSATPAAPEEEEPDCDE